MIDTIYTASLSLVILGKHDSTFSSTWQRNKLLPKVAGGYSVSLWLPHPEQQKGDERSHKGREPLEPAVQGKGQEAGPDDQEPAHCPIHLVPQ